MNFDPVKFLIVDDDDVSIMKVKRSIAKANFSNPVLTAQDGVEALEILRGNKDTDRLSPPYIVTLDINMPRMDGFEFLEEYASKENKSNIIAMYTSSSDERDKNKTAKYPFVKKYFLKPIQVSDLESLKSI